jgi:hypothetical protein
LAKGYIIIKAVFKFLNQLPKKEKYDIINKVKQSVVSVVSIIVEDA